MSGAEAAFDFHGIDLTIRSADARIVRLLEPRLRRFAVTARAMPGRPRMVFDYTAADGAPAATVPRAPSTARPVYDAPMGHVVFDDATDRLFIEWEGRLRSAASPDGTVATCLESTEADACWLAAHPFFTLSLLEQLRRYGLYGVHGALLARDGRAIVIPGTSGAGKSTLTLCLLRAGFAFGGDDLCFLARGDDGPRILAFPDEIDVADRTIDFFPELRLLHTRPRRPGGPKRPLLPEEVYPVEFVSSCKPALMVCPRVGTGDESRLERMDPAEALLELVPNVLLTDAARSQAHLDALGELVRLSDCWRLTTGRDFDAIPGLLAGLLDDGNNHEPARHVDRAPARDPVARR